MWQTARCLIYIKFTRFKYTIEKQTNKLASCKWALSRSKIINLICSNVKHFSRDFFINYAKWYCKTRRSNTWPKNRSTLNFDWSFFNGKSVGRQLAARSPKGSQLRPRRKRARTAALIPIIIVGLFFFVHPHRRPSQSLPFPHSSRNHPPSPPVSRHLCSVTVPRSYYVTIKSNRFSEDGIVLRLSRQISGSRLWFRK